MTDKGKGGISEHWKVLGFMLLGVLVGLWMQWKLEAPAWLGLEVAPAQDGVRVVRVQPGSPAAKKGIAVGDHLRGAVSHRGTPEEQVLPLRTPGDLTVGVLEQAGQGEVLWLLPAREPESPLPAETFDPQTDEAIALTVALSPQSQRARWIAPFTFAADLFIALLKMLIVPVVLSSIVAGIAGVGAMSELAAGHQNLRLLHRHQPAGDLRRPDPGERCAAGDGAQLGLAYQPFHGEVGGGQYLEVIQRMVPQNVFTALGTTARCSRSSSSRCCSAWRSRAATSRTARACRSGSRA
ncbi:MAG: cation:dicarboxylase symporter family transporter [Planctomycetota bacterium]